MYFDGISKIAIQEGKSEVRDLYQELSRRSYRYIRTRGQSLRPFPRKSGSAKPFWVSRYLKTERCIRLKLLVWRESLFILKEKGSLQKKPIFFVNAKPRTKFSNSPKFQPLKYRFSLWWMKFVPKEAQNRTHLQRFWTVLISSQAAFS